ncbi:MAG: O-antigen export system permease RfbD [Myxococcaceae bacterium]|nr:O-antigen export system permease RfbD [Myxococcaceae bacterium]
MFRNLRELYQYRALLWSLTARELKARYRASVLGFLWTFLNPTLNMLVYALVFGFLLKSGQPAYSYFLFIALLPWIFFSTSVGGGASSVSDRRDLLTKVRFPAQVLPATVVATNLLNYLLSLPLLIGLGIFYGQWPTWHVVLFFPLVLLQTIFILGLTYLVSAFNVALRDLQHIVMNVMQMMFFLTPIVWSVSSVPPQYQQLLLYGNPMAALISAYRSIFYEHTLPDPLPLAVVAAFSLGMLWLSSGVFERRREEFAELV